MSLSIVYTEPRFRIGGCPKCGGALIKDPDKYNQDEWYCLYCGYRKLSHEPLTLLSPHPRVKQARDRLYRKLFPCENCGKIRRVDTKAGKPIHSLCKACSNKLRSVYK